METENPGFFLSDPQLCRKRYFRRSLFPGSAATKRRFFSSVVFMRIYNIRSAFDGRIYAVLGMETGMILALSVLEFGIYGGVAGAGLLMPQYLVYIPAYFILQVSYTDNRMGSGKIMDLCRRKQGLIFGRGSQFFCCIQEESSQKVF